MKNNRTLNKKAIRSLALAALFGAIATILQIFEFPLPFLIPAFVKFDFSDLPALFAAFSLGPWYGVAVMLIKNVIHLITSNSAGIGELANFLIGTAFVLPAGAIYARKKTRSFALLGSGVGIVAGAAMSFPINLFITYPFYAQLMPIDTIINMYNEIANVGDGLWKVLLIFNVPFTALKFVAVSVIVFLIYKSVSPLLKRFVGSDEK